MKESNDVIYKVSLKSIVDEFALKTLYMPENDVMITRSDLMRPGLAFNDFYGYFDASRIQIIGNGEWGYLSTLDHKTYLDKVDAFMSHDPVAIVFTRGIVPGDDFIELAKKYKVPVLVSPIRTSELMSMLISSLSLSLAPRITRSGVFLEVYGEGVLILGDSGIGKSETAIELVKRGHRLIADDAVEIKKASSKTLVGSAPDLIRHYVELRGIGIVDVKRLFGIGSVKDTGKIEMIVNLEPWVEGKMYDRFGLEEEHTEIMGISIPTTTIPVRPGRNLSIIIEVAAMNNRQKRMGYNTAVEFNKRLMSLAEKETQN